MKSWIPLLFPLLIDVGLGFITPPSRWLHPLPHSAVVVIKAVEQPEGTETPVTDPVSQSPADEDDRGLFDDEPMTPRQPEWSSPPSPYTRPLSERLKPPSLVDKNFGRAPSRTSQEMQPARPSSGENGWRRKGAFNLAPEPSKARQREDQQYVG